MMEPEEVEVVDAVDAVVVVTSVTGIVREEHLVRVAKEAIANVGAITMTAM